MTTVLSVTSEIFPLIKTGGLADVAGALPAALRAQGVAMRTLVPGYPAVIDSLDAAETVVETSSETDDLMGGPARILSGTTGSLDLLVLDAPHLYARPGNPYLDSNGEDWPDNPQRFAALSLAASRIGQGLIPGFVPDVIHAHDWQAGLVPAYLALSDKPGPATVMTIHNIAFQGWTPPSLLDVLGLPARAFTIDGLEYHGGIGMLKAGLYYATKITTVSPTYAREILTPDYGMGLDGLLRSRARDLEGIVNGIDEEVWNPGTDAHLAEPYNARKLARRARNKQALQARMGLDETAAAPLFCVVSRLTWQKGMDLLLEVLPHLLAEGAQLALLGSGDTALEQGFVHLTRRHPGRIACIIGYDEPLSHLMQGGADAILVPSRFEPCGLTQLYGLRYGCVPVVAHTGGLADTVIDANDAALADKVATGVQLSPVTASALAAAISRTTRIHRDKKAWQALQRRGMSRPVGWQRPAERYAALYREAIAASMGKD